MNFAYLPKPKQLLYRIAVAPVAFFFLFALASCATTSIEVMTKKVGMDVEKDALGNFDDFRFRISTEVTLIRRYSQTYPDKDQTVVRKDSYRNKIILAENKPGRLQSGDVYSALNVSFEDRNGNRPTLAFVQNKGKGDEDKFYFDWKIDPETDERYIEYEDAQYYVYYSGDEEPFLRYKRIEREIPSTRRMRGIR